MKAESATSHMWSFQKYNAEKDKIIGSEKKLLLTDVCIFEKSIPVIWKIIRLINTSINNKHTRKQWSV